MKFITGVLIAIQVFAWGFGLYWFLRFLRALPI